REFQRIDRIEAEIAAEQRRLRIDVRGLHPVDVEVGDQEFGEFALGRGLLHGGFAIHRNSLGRPGRVGSGRGVYHRVLPRRVPEPDPSVEPSCLTRAAVSVADRADAAGIDVSYEQGAAAEWLARSDVLAVIGFDGSATVNGTSQPPGTTAATRADPRVLRVGLASPAGRTPLEIWRTHGPVECGRHGHIRHA